MQCERCRKETEDQELSSINPTALRLMAFGGMGLPKKEALKVYCPTCSKALSRGAVFLGVLGIIFVIGMICMYLF